jgi:hypothetical protein
MRVDSETFIWVLVLAKLVGLLIGVDWKNRCREAPLEVKDYRSRSMALEYFLESDKGQIPKAFLLACVDSNDQDVIERQMRFLE